MIGRLKPVLRKFYGLLLKGMGAERIAGAITATAVSLAEALPPERALPFLLEIDSRLYPHQSASAVRFGGGVHVKHRLIRYHDFFVERIAAGQSVLDIGCGIGTVAYSIASRCGAEVTGIDLNEANIAQARSRYSLTNLRFVQGNALTDLPDTTFDVVVLSNVLEHFLDRVEFLQSLRRCIAPASVLVRVPLYERDWRVAAKHELGVEWRLDSTHFTEYTVDSFAEEACEGGFVLKHMEIHWGEIWADLESRDVCG